MKMYYVVSIDKQVAQTPDIRIISCKPNLEDIVNKLYFFS